MEGGHPLLGPRVGMFVGALGTGLMFIFPAALWLGGALIFVGAIPLAQWGVSKVMSVSRSHPRTPQMPLAVTTVQVNHFANYAFNDDDKDHDAMAWALRPITFTNLSRTDALVLEIHLRITEKDGKTNIPLSTDATDGFGRRYGTYKGRVIADYLRYPLRIGPHDTVKGSLAFVFAPFDQAMRARLVQLMIKDRLILSLEIIDHVSGVQIAIELPGSYRGSANWIPASAAA